MSEMFGFDDAIKEIEGYLSKANKAKNVMREVADEMRDVARNKARAGGLFRTGEGISGIESVHHSDYSEVGWATRPNFHLYFHERGFHALDNRRKTWQLKRSRKGKKRSYRGVSATYIPPTPHIRPAFTIKEHEFYRRIQKEITE